MRGLLKPGPGQALSYIDWSQQEFGIAAALSRDTKMLEAYSTGDPYLAFAKQAGAIPTTATQESHAKERERFKACTLAVQYGMGAETLALRTGQTPSHAAALLRQHRETYRTFWSWSDRVFERALSDRKLVAAFGWTLNIASPVNERSIRNFPMQANGSEMMRIACFLAVEAGVEVCAPVHDAFVIEASIDKLPDAEQIMLHCMEEASRAVLRGFSLRADTKRIVYPARFEESRDSHMWNRVQDLLSVYGENNHCSCCTNAHRVSVHAHPPYLLEGSQQ
jgi:DNA polymerase I-like protein with 3'-5' exonuclease and polymerase domains